MLDYCDFVEQARVESEDGRLQPDLIIRLPGDKTIVVDAKAPLAAYLDASDGNCEDGARDLLLKKHARQVRDHMVKLGGKAYWNQFQPAPDFVVMFLPGETFFSAACQHDPSLIEFGVSEQVIPASPTTLIALLRCHRLRLAAGEHRAERPGDQQAGSRAVRATGQHGGALRGHAEGARASGGELQRRDRIAGGEGAGVGPAVQGLGDCGRGATGGANGAARSPEIDLCHPEPSEGCLRVRVEGSLRSRPEPSLKGSG